MKIPTLIGIALIIALLGSLGFWFLSGTDNGDAPSFIVSDLQTVNISDTAATVVWQTNLPSIGEVRYGELGNLNQKSIDNRDLKNPTEKYTHFVTLKNLKPNTQYYYKITNNSAVYSEKTQQFQTANIEKPDDLNFSFVRPLKGTILNTTLNPIDESLIFLEIPGAQSLATFSSTAGNFIMPLKLVLNSDLSQVFNIPQDTAATLTVRKGMLKSTVKLLISQATVNLPQITLGSDLDLSGFIQEPPKAITIGVGGQVNLDFNADGRINSLDLAILRGKAGSGSLLNTQDQAKFDINSDGIVDQEDVSIFSRSLTPD